MVSDTHLPQHRRHQQRAHEQDNGVEVKGHRVAQVVVQPAARQRPQCCSQVEGKSVEPVTGAARVLAGDVGALASRKCLFCPLVIARRDGWLLIVCHSLQLCRAIASTPPDRLAAAAAG